MSIEWQSDATALRVRCNALTGGYQVEYQRDGAWRPYVRETTLPCAMAWAKLEEAYQDALVALGDYQPTHVRLREPFDALRAALDNHDAGAARDALWELGLCEDPLAEALETYLKLCERLVCQEHGELYLECTCVKWCGSCGVLCDEPGTGCLCETGVALRIEVEGDGRDYAL